MQVVYEGSVLLKLNNIVSVFPSFHNWLTCECVLFGVQVGSVLLLGQLPCLELLTLVGNPLTKENLYRVRVLSMFDERASQVSEKCRGKNVGTCVVFGIYRVYSMFVF